MRYYVSVRVHDDDDTLPDLYVVSTCEKFSDDDPLVEAEFFEPDRWFITDTEAGGADDGPLGLSAGMAALYLAGKGVGEPLKLSSDSIPADFREYVKGIVLNQEWRKYIPDDGIEERVTVFAPVGR